MRSSPTASIDSAPLDPPSSATFAQALRTGTFAFRRRLSVGALVGVLLLAGVAAALAWRQYTDGRQRALNDTHARVVLAASLLNTYFGGEISILTAVAKAPVVVARNEQGMTAYFRSVEAGRPKLFNGGIGWIDLRGFSRASSDGLDSQSFSVADRDYFKTVVATRKPFVSEGLISRRTHRQIIVMAVPTFAANGHVTGVLAGSLLTKPTGNNKASIDLGYAGLAILDRKDQLVLGGLARPQNSLLVARLHKQSVGTFSSSDGLDGASGHVVAFATSAIPDWKIVIDGPRAAVFAAARRGLILELISIGAAGALILTLFGWIMVGAHREEAREQERMRQWNELTRTLGGAAAADDVFDALASALAAAFPAAASIVALEVDGRLRQVASVAPTRTGRMHPAEERLLAEAATIAYDTHSWVAIPNEPTMRDEHPHLYNLLGSAPRSVYAAPLTADDGRCIGALSLVFREEHVLDEAERVLIAAQADEAAHAFVRAERHERDHEVAVRLQRSLLSENLPGTEDIDVAARYQAGADGLEVGGDWYDVVRRPDGIVHFSVGDVAGRGLAAAALMGQLRNAFRAYAYDHASPGDVVRRLTRHVDDDQMATTVCLTLDPCTGDLAYASAGHPPTILLDHATGAVSRLDQVSSPPLGYARAAGVRETRLSLPVGATLAAYTDGLVERRGTSIETGIALLEATMGAGASLSADDLANTILKEIVNSQGANALLVVRLPGVPARMSIELPAHPGALARMRKRLNAWLTRRGVDDAARADAVLAVSEACNNAVEHAYGHDEGTIQLDFEHRAGILELQIKDFGTWREHNPAPERGRGTPIMKSLMDTTRVVHDRRGTSVTLELRVV